METAIVWLALVVGSVVGSAAPGLILLAKDRRRYAAERHAQVARHARELSEQRVRLYGEAYR